MTSQPAEHHSPWAPFSFFMRLPFSALSYGMCNKCTEATPIVEDLRISSKPACDVAVTDWLHWLLIVRLSDCLSLDKLWIHIDVLRPAENTSTGTDADTVNEWLTFRASRCRRVCWPLLLLKMCRFVTLSWRHRMGSLYDECVTNVDVRVNAKTSVQRTVKLVNGSDIFTAP